MVHEIVVPDVLCDAHETLKRAEKFARLADRRFNYMTVVQGTKWEQLANLISQYAEMDWISTLGIPRHLIETTDTPNIRMQLCQHLNKYYPGRFKIHLLGTAPAVIDELNRYWAVFSAFNVRGVDTSAPYVYANEGHKLSALACIRRPEDYYNITTMNSELVDENIDTLLRWANYYAVSS